MRKEIWLIPTWSFFVFLVIMLSGCSIGEAPKNTTTECLIYNHEILMWEEPLEVNDFRIYNSGWELELENGNKVIGNNVTPIICIQTED